VENPIFYTFWGVIVLFFIGAIAFFGNAIMEIRKVLKELKKETENKR